ncbi:MAG: Rubrerythrin [Chitinivibrionales bacterium]|nr:Rubrerythrin [Chitinivibrionales bacterium]
MPEFVNPFSGVVPGRPLTFRELTRAIRLSLTAEYEAVHLYEALADATENKLAKTVLQDISNEERVHAGEFQRLLNILLEDEATLLQEGADEVDEMRESLDGNGGNGRDETEEQPGGSVPTPGDLRS